MAIRYTLGDRIVYSAHPQSWAIGLPLRQQLSSDGIEGFRRNDWRPFEAEIQDAAKPLSGALSHLAFGARRVIWLSGCAESSDLRRYLSPMASRAFGTPLP